MCFLLFYSSITCFVTFYIRFLVKKWFDIKQNYTDVGWNKFEMFSTSQIFSNTSLSENLVKFYLNYFKDKPNIKTRKFQFLNSSSKEEDIKLYISKDDDISRILYMKYSSQSGDYGYFYWRIFVDIACRQEIKLDWSPTLQQKRFFVRRLFLFSFSILDVEKNWIFVWSCCRTEL